MAFTKYIVPALMASGVAMASSQCGTTNITSQSDADTLASSCTTITGDINIVPGITNGLTFNNIQSIDGDLIADGVTNISSISFPSLVNITGEFSLSALILLTELDFPVLTSIGSINWETLPALQSLSFTAGVNQTGSVSIQDTALTSLSGIELDTVGDFDLTANNYLTSVNVNNIKSITGSLTITANSNELEVIFPNLLTASNMTFRNTSTISVPSLANLTGELGLFGNYITNFSAPNLTTCTDLDIENNAKLSELSFPVLKTVKGGLTISSNDDLSTISFPALTSVSGAVDLTGDYTNVSMPELTEVKGGFNAESTGNFSCDAFDQLKSSVGGSYTCKTTANPTNLDGSSGSSSTSTSSAATSSGVAAGNVAPSMGLTAVVGALLSLLM